MFKDQVITVVFKLYYTLQKHLCNPKYIQDDFEKSGTREIECNVCDKCIGQTRRFIKLVSVNALCSEKPGVAQHVLHHNNSVNYFSVRKYGIHLKFLYILIWHLIF